MEPLVPGLHSDGKFYVQGILEDHSFDTNTSGVLDSLVDLSTEKVEFGGTSNDIFYLILLGKSDIQACQCVETLTSPYWLTLSFGCFGTDFGEPIQLTYIGSGVILTSLATIFGGTVGQEVVKACSRKLHPVHQFFYFDSVESLSVDTLNPGEVEPQFCRYDDQIGVFGYKLQKKLEDAKVFIVGAVALGCEFLTNWALMGVCCGSKGKLTITDDDCSLICSVITWGGGEYLVDEQGLGVFGEVEGGGELKDAVGGERDVDESLDGVDLGFLWAGVVGGLEGRGAEEPDEGGVREGAGEEVEEVVGGEGSLGGEENRTGLAGGGEEEGVERVLGGREGREGL
ncbi:hypothetical protein J5N97_025736 [Dioscorea zingiberensis]|uniref:THIF-type NAD/FAD binding fold domain-containing protein n=1 Tax=Dioscorea zingiberensis TaxID=325984 RepID=A0A9D5C1Q0_9LILI|nr:hypothetical protein J5N97_025736 [Dioscorea zingiberensis]